MEPRLGSEARFSVARLRLEEFEEVIEGCRRLGDRRRLGHQFVQRVIREGRAPLTHEFLAMMLAVRRSGVTVAVQQLERQGVICKKAGAYCYHRPRRASEVY